MIKKFRIWNSKTNKFTYFDIFDINTIDWELFDEKPNIQQFIGLKDCKNVDIYEGDIVSFFFFIKDGSGKIYDSPIESTAEVKYKDDSAEFILEIDGYKGSGWTFSMLMTFVEIDSQEWHVERRIEKLKLTVVSNISGKAKK
jgi:hypothetical protein